MRVASMVVTASPGGAPALHGKLGALSGVEVVEADGNALAVLLEAETPTAQRHMHERISELAEVESVALVFQSSEV